MNANVGMRYPVFATVQTYTAGTSISYATGAAIAEAVSASINWEREDGQFYGDDVQLDSANGVLGYTLDFEPSGIPDSVRNTLLGETVSSSEYTITSKSAPDVGFGYIRVMRTSGTSGVNDAYEGWWYYKLKFGITSEEARTKERNIEWRTPTLQGIGSGVSLDNSGDLKFAVHKSFDSFSAAQTWLKAKANIS